MSETKHDIRDRDDIRILVDTFYDKVQADATLSPVFHQVDWPHHLPIMYNFWSTILLGDLSYQGNPLQKHLHLPIDSVHFARWLALFRETIDQEFTGEKAEEAKMRAQSIAGVFQFKMGLPIDKTLR